ncbi:hypothetical protein T484DRAFT_1889437, partial [Baffinella frigidus]
MAGPAGEAGEENQMTEEGFRVATGGGDLADLTSAELMITPFPCFAPRALIRCAHLRELTIIGSGLRSAAALAPLGRSLRRLSLPHNDLTSLETFPPLPNLQELFLQNNRISSLGNLSAVPRVRRVWLFSNQLRSARGIAVLQDLRELWLQDNLLSDLDALQGLIHLRRLALGGNPLADLEALAPLAADSLPLLASLSLADPHFDRSPLIELHCYRQEVIWHLPRLEELDGEKVGEEERAGVQDRVLAEALEVSDAIEEARQRARDREADRARKRALAEQAAGSAEDQLRAALFEMRDSLSSAAAARDALSREAAALARDARTAARDRVAELGARHHACAARVAARLEASMQEERLAAEAALARLDCEAHDLEVLARLSLSRPTDHPDR